MSNSIFFIIINFLIVIVITKIPSSFSLSFNLSTIGPGFINFSAADTFHYREGWAPYAEPLHLWDRGSRSLTDFTTHFSFVMDSIIDLTFFLAPNGSMMNQSSLENQNQSLSVTFFNTHIRVIISSGSVASGNSTTWNNNNNETLLTDAWITYNATSKTLIVQVTTDLSGNRTTDILTYVVDFSNVLPEYVTLGFKSMAPTNETHILRSWQFSSTFPIPVRTPPTNTNHPDPPEHNKKLVQLTVGLSVGIVFLGLVFASFCLWKKDYEKGLRYDDNDDEVVDPDMDTEFEKGTGAKRFSYRELVLATKGFDEDEKLGEGGFGGVYRGFLKETESYVAVKRVSRGSKQGLKEYASEVKIISQLRHRNLVQLFGWCHQIRGKLLLVYEFMPNGSLDSHLFKSKSVLTWEVRYKIAQGLASALLYLHEEWERCVVHRDIKSSNIMLDSNFNAKLGDFGLARLVDHEKGSQTTVLAGTLGYMAPECAATGRASKETDVYSFGIVLLEICCGRRPIDNEYQDMKRVVLVEWVWSLYGVGRLNEAADPKFLSTDFDEREMEQVMVVGLWCAHPDNKHRPSIRQAIQALNFEVPLPTLPRELPVPMYMNPPSATKISVEIDSSKYSTCGSTSSSVAAR